MRAARLPFGCGERQKNVKKARGISCRKALSRASTGWRVCQHAGPVFSAHGAVGIIFFRTRDRSSELVNALRQRRGHGGAGAERDMNVVAADFLVAEEGGGANGARHSRISRFRHFSFGGIWGRFTFSGGG